MLEASHRLFAGIKISTQLQNRLNNPAPGTERYFTTENSDYLHVVKLGEEKFIGRYLKDGFPAAEIENISRNVCSIVRLIAQGQRFEEKSVHIYVA
jgi:hypothetical protein